MGFVVGHGKDYRELMEGLRAPVQFYFSVVRRLEKIGPLLDA